MTNKKLLVSFLAVLAVCFLIASVSAYVDGEGYNIQRVTVDDGATTIEAGETVTVDVWFTAGPNTYDKDVTVEVTIDGDDFEVSAETSEFDIMPNDTLKKTLRLEIPEEIEDKIVDDKVIIEVKVKGDDYKEYREYDTVSIKRTPYKIAIKSIATSQNVDAGETFPVDIVLKNIGYNDLDDLYVTAQIAELGVQTSGYFGDIVALECDNNDEDEFPWDSTLDRNCDEDDEDSIYGRLYLEVPYDVASGVYMLEVEVENDDTSTKEAVQIVVENNFEDTVFKSGNKVWIVNPTDELVGYRIVAESPASVSESIAFVSAGATKTIDVDPNVEGEYSFAINVFSMKGELLDTILFNGNTGTQTQDETNPIVILTVILAIIFIVLLIVLIVLIGKKPEKTGEFGESYY